MWQHEPCFYGWRQGKQPPRRPPTNDTTVWHISQQGEQDGIHPTQKPVELFKRPIEYHTRPGEVAYKPFLGSGTQLIAAEQLERRCDGMELEPAYVDVVVRGGSSSPAGRRSGSRADDPTSACDPARPFS